MMELFSYKLTPLFFLLLMKTLFAIQAFNSFDILFLFKRKTSTINNYSAMYVRKNDDDKKNS